MEDYNNLHKLWARAHVAGSPTKYVRNAVVLRELGKLLPGFTLDAGCGMGEYSIFLAECGHKVIAFDPSPFAVQKLMDNGGTKLGIDGRVNAIEEFHSSDSFDNIVSIDVIEHIEFDHAVIRKLYLLLKEDGTLVISTPANPYLYSHGDRISGHFRRYSIASFKELFIMAGFRDIMIIRYGFPVLFAYSIIRKIFLDKILIKYFLRDTSTSIGSGRLLSKLYRYVLYIDRLNIPFWEVGYVAICKK